MKKIFALVFCVLFLFESESITEKTFATRKCFLREFTGGVILDYNEKLIQQNKSTETERYIRGELEKIKRLLFLECVRRSGNLIDLKKNDDFREKFLKKTSNDLIKLMGINSDFGRLHLGYKYVLSPKKLLVSSDAKFSADCIFVESPSVEFDIKEFLFTKFCFLGLEHISVKFNKDWLFSVEFDPTCCSFFFTPELKKESPGRLFGRVYVAGVGRIFINQKYFGKL